MDDLISEFIEETNESLELLDQEMIRFEQDPSDKDILSNIFRVMHTIKGTCGFLGLPRLERVAHAGEDVLGKFRDGELNVTSDAVSLILKCIDHIRGLLMNLQETGEEGAPTEAEEQLVGCLRDMAEGQQVDAPVDAVESPDTSVAQSDAADAGAAESDAGDDDSIPSPEGFPIAAEFLAEFEGLSAEDESAAEGAVDGDAGQPSDGEVVELAAAPETVAEEDLAPQTASEPEEAPEGGVEAQRVAVTESIAPAESVQAQKPSEPQQAGGAKRERVGSASQSIRVNVEVIENLMTMVSEMVLARNQLLQLTRDDNDENIRFKEPVERLSRIASDLQEGVMKTRMQPIGNAWNKLPRIVRDLSGDLGKKIELVMSGEDTELDRQVLELIQDPLTHMVRNSVDHGIELPDERTAEGKNQTGTIRLSAYHEGGHIIIEIKDDGKGLNTEAIRVKIVEKGLASADEVAGMDDARVNRFILEPGFSTAKAVTKVSGRGVGMDVVRSNIEKIGGNIDFSSVYGEGSTFTIKIPLTLAIVAALIVESSGHRFAIPQIAVNEVVRISKHSGHRLEKLNGAPVMRLRNKLLPLIDLSGLLELSEGLQTGDSDAFDFEGFVVVSRVGNRQAGILVDRIADSEEIVVKPLAPIISNTKFYSGNTILGDGTVILILDTNGLGATLSFETTKDEEDSLEVDERMRRGESILVFQNDGESLCAVPLSSVHRIENFDMETTEVVQGDVVVQYRERLLPLVSVSGPQGVARTGRQTVLVFGDDSEGVGLAIKRIVDIMEEELSIQKSSSDPRLIGSAIVGGRAVEVINPDYFHERATAESNTADVSISFGEAA